MNITLIGMAGAGKSYMGKILAKKLGFNFVDIDLVMETKFNKKLQLLVDMFGDEKFIEEETKVVLELIDKDKLIISPGGSIVYSVEAMNHLKKISKVVFLNVPLSMIKPRIAEKPRGIIGMRDKTIDDIYEERLPLYFKYSDLTIDDNEIKTADDIVNEIRKGLGV